MRIREGCPPRSHRETGRAGIMKYCSEPSPQQRLTLQQEGLRQGKFWNVVPAAGRKCLCTPAPSSLPVSCREKQQQQQQQNFKEVLLEPPQPEKGPGEGGGSTRESTLLEATLLKHCRTKRLRVDPKTGESTPFQYLLTTSRAPVFTTVDDS